MQCKQPGLRTELPTGYEFSLLCRESRSTGSDVEASDAEIPAVSLGTLPDVGLPYRS